MVLRVLDTHVHPSGMRRPSRAVACRLTLALEPA
jgi:hypothetical protein